MKKIVLKILFCLLIFNIFVPANLAQTGGEQANQNAEIMGEDERLPFMQNEKTAETRDVSSAGLLVKTLGAMLLIVGLIFAGAWGLKKIGFGAKIEAIENAPELAVLNSISTGSGRMLFIVKFGEKTLLVGSTAQTFTLLAEAGADVSDALPPARSVAEMLAEETAVSFGKELSRAEQKFDSQTRDGGRI